MFTNDTGLSVVSKTFKYGDDAAWAEVEVDRDKM